MTTYTMFSVYLLIFSASSILTPGYMAPVIQDKADSDILYYENESDGQGNYKFTFGTADFIRREEVGVVVNPGQPDQYIRVNGTYSYVRPDGEDEVVYYIADKDGFRVVPETPQNQIAVLAGVPPAVLATLVG